MDFNWGLIHNVSSGIIIQFGLYVESKVITLPLAYKSYRYGLCFNPATRDGWSGIIYTYCVTNLTASSFVLHNSGGWNGNFITVGY